jgi:shikimate kinase
LISAIPADANIIPEAWLRKDLVVFDANYKKSFLSEKAQNRGCRVIKGEEWLLNQAVPAYRYFLGTTPEKTAIEAMRTALLSASATKPRNVALVGFMGCGKTAIGRLLAKKMGLVFKDTDDLIEAREGRSIPEIFKTDGEAYFRKVEKAILKQELENHTGVVYGCGGGVVLDEKNKKNLKTNALVVWLYSSIETTLKRIPPGTRPLLDCPNPEEKARDLLDRRLIHYSRAADLIVSSEMSAEKTSEKIHEEISKTFGD